MRKNELYPDYHDFLECFGNTEIEMIRKRGDETIRYDWLIFDSGDEAIAYVNDNCGEQIECHA